jgi:hypothetical protein
MGLVLSLHGSGRFALLYHRLETDLQHVRHGCAGPLAIALASTD